LWNNENRIKSSISNMNVVWGGLIRLWTTEELNKYENIILFVILILSFAGISSIKINFIEYMFYNYIKCVKKSINIGWSAEIRKWNYSTFSNISQRLESGDSIYPYLVGLIEGDGWFSVSKKGKYITYELGIELSIKDTQLLYKIKSLLGVGTILFRHKSRTHPVPPRFNKSVFDSLNKVDNILNIRNELVNNMENTEIKEKYNDSIKNLECFNNMVVYRIRDKSHLKEVIIPIFDKYPFFSNKLYDYIRFKNLLLSNIIYSKDLTPYIRSNIPINTVESIMNASYFSAWLIGFIEGESSFSCYKPMNSSSSVASFEITQTDNEIIILAIKKFLRLTPNVLNYNNNYRIKVSGVRGIENIVKFMGKAPIKLLGYKKLQYIIWLNKLKKIPRYYNKIHLPNSY